MESKHDTELKTKNIAELSNDLDNVLAETETLLSETSKETDPALQAGLARLQRQLASAARTAQLLNK